MITTMTAMMMRISVSWQDLLNMEYHTFTSIYDVLVESLQPKQQTPKY